MSSKRLDTYTVTIHCMLVGLAALVAVLVSENRALRALVAPPPPELTVGEAVPEVAVRGLEGGEELLSFAPAERESLLLVFTTTCSACRANQDAWRSLYEDTHDRLRVVGVSLDDPDATRAYREEHALPFPVVVPADPQAFARDYAVTRVPFTVHLGRDGRVKGAWFGGLYRDALASL